MSFEDNGRLIDDNLGRSFRQSTPTTRGQFHDFIPPGNLVEACLSGTFSSTTCLTFVHMPGMKKWPLVFSPSSNSDTTENMSPEWSIPCRNWTLRVGVKPVTYIDDTNGLERLSLAKGEYHITEEKQKISIHARKSQEFFATVKARADNLGTRINGEKAQMLCVHPNGSSNVSSYVCINGEKINSSKTLKICGFTFGERPDVSAHFTSMKNSFNKRVWSIRHLKRAGFGCKDLLELYGSLV